MLASGATAIAGFAVLMFSSIRMLRDFGFVTVVDLTVSLLGVMVVLPAVLVLAERGELLSLPPARAGARASLRPLAGRRRAAAAAADPPPHESDHARTRALPGARGRSLRARSGARALGPPPRPRPRAPSAGGGGQPAPRPRPGQPLRLALRVVVVLPALLHRDQHAAHRRPGANAG